MSRIAREKGEMKVKMASGCMLTIMDVHYVPGLRVNLLAPSRMMRHGCKVNITTDAANKSDASAVRAVLDVVTTWIAPRPWLRACRQTFFVWSLLNLPVSVALAIQLMGSALSVIIPVVSCHHQPLATSAPSQHACGRLRSFFGAACTDPRMTLPCLATGVICCSGMDWGR
jgi:hypothetical protein